MDGSSCVNFGHGCSDLETYSPNASFSTRPLKLPNHATPSSSSHSFAGDSRIPSPIQSLRISSLILVEHRLTSWWHLPFHHILMTFLLHSLSHIHNLLFPFKLFFFNYFFPQQPPTGSTVPSCTAATYDCGDPCTTTHGWDMPCIAEGGIAQSSNLAMSCTPADDCSAINQSAANKLTHFDTSAGPRRFRYFAWGSCRITRPTFPLNWHFNDPLQSPLHSFPTLSHSSMPKSSFSVSDTSIFHFSTFF